VVIACVQGCHSFLSANCARRIVTGTCWRSPLDFVRCYFLLLRHAKSRAVNRASSVIYGNLLLVAARRTGGLKALPQITSHDAFSVIYLGVVQIGLAYTLFTVAMARGVARLTRALLVTLSRLLNPIWVYLVLW